MILALMAAAHVYVLPWKKMLFMLPAESGRACGVASVRYGPQDGSWEGGANLPAPDCHFRVSVAPGSLLPAWAEEPAKPVVDSLDVTFTLAGRDKPQTVTAKAEKIEPAPAQPADFRVKAAKVRDSVRVEVTNTSGKPLVVGDATALRGKPKDDCVGPGPAAVIQPGETLVDQRPGLLSKSMNVWVSVFTGESQCRWVEVQR